MKDLTKGNILKVILQFALPVFIGNLFNLAYNLADTRIIGSYLGSDALAAVGSVSTLSDLIVGFVFGLANGFAVITARFFGMKDDDSVRKSFALSLELGVIISIIIALVSYFGLPGIFRWLNVNPQHEIQARAYIVIIITGLIFSCIYNVLASSLRAIGDAYTPLIFLIVSAVINVGLDILFVGGLGKGVAGAAMATVISQLISAVLCFIYALVRYPIFRFKGKDLVPVRAFTAQLLSGGFSMGLMSSLVAFGTLSLQTAINRLGSDIIVAHTGARKLTNLYMMPFSVFGTTMATFSGQNYGAKRIDRIKGGLKTALIINLIWISLVIIMSWTICPMLIKLITAVDKKEIIDNAVRYQRFDTAFYPIAAMVTLFRNTLQGMGDHISPVISSGLELGGKVIIAITLTPILAYWGIIIAEPIVWAIMVIPLIISLVIRLKKAQAVTADN
ncbi:MAG: MATE family efflux transporter [Lachnospiraceae bacterium]|nr:MATE family efflux transporter [Lachnospiraceae bacterium]